MKPLSHLPLFLLLALFTQAGGQTTGNLIGPRYVLDTQDPKPNPQTGSLTGPRFTLDTRNTSDEDGSVVGPRFTLDTRVFQNQYGLFLSYEEVFENKPIGTEVGKFIYIAPPPPPPPSSPTPIDPFPLSGDWDREPAVPLVQGIAEGLTLVDGEGSTHNHLFALEDGILKTAAVLDHKANPHLTIRVRGTFPRQFGMAPGENEPMWYEAERTFTITVLENPIDINPPPDPTYYEKKYNEALTRLEALRALEGEKNATIAQRKVCLDELQGEISVVDKSLREANASLATCEKECEGLKSDHKAIDGAIGVEDAKIYDLEGKIGASEKKLADLEKDKSKLEEDLAEAERKASVPHTPGWHFIDGKGWLWTSPDYFSLIYSEQVGGWFYYEPGTHGPWLYYDYNSEAWQEW